MNKVLVELIANLASFFEFSDESDVRLDVAVRPLEEIGFRLQGGRAGVQPHHPRDRHDARECDGAHVSRGVPSRLRIGLGAGRPGSIACVYAGDVILLSPSLRTAIEVQT
jgi:hypothetical protein